MSREHPAVVILAGPNGAGKSTTGPSLLRDTLDISQLVNADSIALGLSAFQPESVAMQAGRVMLLRLRELSHRREDFAFETTMAGRSLARWIPRLRRSGYCAHILFLWLPTAELAIERVADRVRMGGHDVSQEVIRRRFHAGLRNFFRLYRPLADTWRLYDNSGGRGPRLVASGSRRGPTRVADARSWRRIQKDVGR